MNSSLNEQVQKLTSSNFYGLWAISSTLLILLCGLLCLSLTNLQYICWPLGFILTTLPLIRLIMLGHDIGHNILFSSLILNKITKFVVGSLIALPLESWSRGHALHHKYNGNLSIYKGPLVIMSTQEVVSLPLRTRRSYIRSRNLLNLYIASSLRYLIIPRLRLIPGWTKRTVIRNPSYRYNLYSCIIDTSKGLIVNKKEIIDTSISSAGFIIILFVLSSISLTHLIVYLASVSFSFYITDIIFHMQHNFEGSYASSKLIWDYDRAIFESTANIRFPFCLEWFMANIGYHQAHHLWPQVPFYHLKRANSLVKDNDKCTTLNFLDFNRCIKLIAWDIRKSTYCTASLQ